MTSCALVSSQQYLKKAGLIAGTFSDVHTEEMRTRHLFQEKLNRHFLASMFQVSQQPPHLLTYHDNDDPVQGMEDLPPDFATIPPESFDTALPRITLQDPETLRAEFPNIAESLSMPDRCWCSN